MSTTLTLNPTAVSGQSDGAAVFSANPATIVIGGVAPNKHGLLRFDTSQVPAANEIVSAELTVKVSALGAGSPPDLAVWASDFGLTIANADYGLPSNPTPAHFAAGRAFLDRIVLGSAIVDESGTITIPTQYIHKEEDVTGGTGNGTATGGTATTITDSAQTWTVDQFATYHVKIIAGTGIGQDAIITSNTADTLTFPALGTPPDNTSVYQIYNGVFDCELRPYVATAGATDTITVYGPSHGTAGNRPKLVVVHETVDNLRVENTFFEVGVGAESYLGFDIETTRGVPVKAQHLVDMTGSSMDQEAQTILGQSMRRERSAPVKVALGAAGAGGGFTAEATPERIWKLLLGICAVESTASLGSLEGNDGAFYTCYNTTLKPTTNKNIKTFTFVQRDGQGSYRFVYPGCVVDSFAITNGLDRAVDVNVSLMGREELVYNSDASGGDSDPYLLSANQGYDLNPFLSFVGVEIEKGGVVNDGTIQSFSFVLNNNARPRRGLRRKRSVRSHYVQKVMASIDYTMEFESDVELRKFLGVKHQDFPFRAEMSIQFDSMKVKMAGPLGENVQEVVLTLPKMIYTVMKKPVQGSEIVMLTCSAMGTYSSGDGGNFIIEVRSTEAGSTWLPSTDQITVLPIDR